MAGTWAWPLIELGATWPATRPLLWRAVYDRASRLDAGGFRYMNWGFSGPPLPRLELADDPEQTCAHLVHHVASQANIAGAAVVDLGCGRGGGAGYVRRVLGPRSVVGVDNQAAHVRQASERYAGEAGLDFVVAPLERVPFQRHSFDVALCIDTSHAVADMDALLAEAFRILRPGGELLLADLREDWGPDEQRMAAHGFALVEVEELSDGVVAALDQDAERRRRLARTQPLGLRGAAEVLLGVPGTPLIEGLREGWLQHMRYRLRRPGG